MIETIIKKYVTLEFYHVLPNILVNLDKYFSKSQSRISICIKGRENITFPTDSLITRMHHSNWFTFQINLIINITFFFFIISEMRRLGVELSLKMM